MIIQVNFRAVCIGLAFVVLVGCGTTAPSQLYVLEPSTSGHSSRQLPSISIVVQEVRLRDYLARKELLRHDNRYQVSVSEFQRWAEPLQINMTVVLAENLSQLIQSDNVVAYPAAAVVAIDYEVVVDVYSFGPDPDGNVVLSSRWAIVDSEGSVVASAKSQTSGVAVSNDAVDTVAAMSIALGALSEHIAERLSDLCVAKSSQPGGSS